MPNPTQSNGKYVSCLKRSNDHTHFGNRRQTNWTQIESSRIIQAHSRQPQHSCKHGRLRDQAPRLVRITAPCTSKAKNTNRPWLTRAAMVEIALYMAESKLTQAVGCGVRPHHQARCWRTARSPTSSNMKVTVAESIRFTKTMLTSHPRAQPPQILATLWTCADQGYTDHGIRRKQILRLQCDPHGNLTLTQRRDRRFGPSVHACTAVADCAAEQ